MTPERLVVFFDDTVLAVRTPDGLFDQVPSPLLDHQLPSMEGPDRIANIRSILKRGPMAGDIDWFPGRPATDAEILLFHEAPYLATIKDWDKEGAWATSTTYLPKGGLAAVRAAAGCALDAVRHVLAGKARRSYALVRPPGHHAAPGVADGYCFVNAAGVAALDALSRGCRRVAVVDWDVHHGNGTQDIFYQRGDVFFASIHVDPALAAPFYAGYADEIGESAGAGLTFNQPLALGADDQTFLTAVDRALTRIRDFNPDAIAVSMGLDASAHDPVATFKVSHDGFAETMRRVQSLARPTLLVQEGGYLNPELGACLRATLAAWRS